MSKSKKSGCGNCGNDCGGEDDSRGGKCNGKCGGKCGDKNCKCKEGVDAKGVCAGGCGKKKDACRCAEMKLCWICERCGAMHKKKRPTVCLTCSHTKFEEKKYLPSD